jgi:rubrerythrin
MAAKGSTWWCDVCAVTRWRADQPKRWRCPTCLHWQARVA